MEDEQRRVRELAQCVAIEMCASRSCGGCLCDETLERVAAEVTALVHGERAESERLRAALREIRDGGASSLTWAQHIATLALSPAPTAEEG